MSCRPFRLRLAEVHSLLCKASQPKNFIFGGTRARQSSHAPSSEVELEKNTRYVDDAE